VNNFVKLAGAGSLVVFALGFLVGSRYFGEQMSTERSRIQALQEQKEKLGIQAAELIRRGVTHDVDTLTLERLRQSVADLEEQLFDQREELMLYSRLLKTDDSKDGLQILDLKINPSDAPLVFFYSFVIRQQAASLKSISVRYAAEVKGQLNGEDYSYTLDELDAAVTSTPVKTKLKYFRVIEGVMKLPKQFAPQKVTIRAWSGKTSGERREQLFDWPDAEDQLMDR
jgi:uncharacterized protein DUF6776